jgi:hypothetical protein
MNTPYVPKPGDVSLFETNRTSDKSPNFNGYCIMPDGTKMNLAVWEKQTARGIMYSGKISPWVEKGDTSAPVYTAHPIGQPYTGTQNRPAQKPPLFGGQKDNFGSPAEGHDDMPF